VVKEVICPLIPIVEPTNNIEYPLKEELNEVNNPVKDVVPEPHCNIPEPHYNIPKGDDPLLELLVEELQHDQSDSDPPGKDCIPEPEDIFKSLK
jgi:hypothetical protein